MRLGTRFMVRMTVLAATSVATALSLSLVAATPPAPRGGTDASPADTPKLDAAMLRVLKWRSIGPAVTGGRTIDFAVAGDNRDIVFAATATGGVWKTVNHGATWEPVFESEGTA